MKPKLRVILERAIEDGVKRGWHRAHKHDDTPDPQYIQDCIEEGVWSELNEVFDFESDASN